MEILASALQLDSSRFSFDPVRYRYLSRGRPFPWSKVALASTQYGRQVELAATDLINRLRRGEITLVQWQNQMMELVKSLHLNNIALSRGGYGQMSPADYGRAGGIIAREYKFLQRMATQIALGLPRDGNLVRRARLFARAGRSTYVRGLQDGMIQRGFDQERSILRPAEHCQECVEQELLGFQEIGKMVPVGDRKCLRNCRCGVIYRRSADGAELGPF